MNADRLVRRGSVPDQVVGPRALRAATASLGVSRPVLFVDTKTIIHADAAREGCPAFTPADSIVVDAPIGWEQVEAFARIIRRAAPDSLLAIGGGSTMDAAKLAGWYSAAGPAARHLRSRSQIDGVLVAARVSDPLPLVCAPTTVGTGAEVSSVACIVTHLGNDRFKCLVGFDDSPVQAAAYEPKLLQMPRSLLLAGIAEAWLRVLGSFVGTSSTIPGADEEALALIRRSALIAQKALRADDPPACVAHEVALASAATHTGWALRGRGPAPSPLWFIANELSMMTSVSKMEATRAILGGWLRSVSTGEAILGDAGRLRLALDASGSASTRDLLASIHALVPAPRIEFSAHRLADRVIARFGRGRPLPRALTGAVITRMVTATDLDPNGEVSGAD